MVGGLKAAAVVAGLLAAGCADDPTLAPASVRDGLGEVLAETGVDAETVECPVPDPELIAQSLTCTALLHGDAITIDVTLADDGAADARVRERLLDLDAVAEELAGRVAADLGVRPDVDCPGGYVRDRAGAEFDCTATHDGRPLVFAVEIVDDESNWTVTYRP